MVASFFSAGIPEVTDAGVVQQIQDGQTFLFSVLLVSWALYYHQSGISIQIVIYKKKQQLGIIIKDALRGKLGYSRHKQISWITSIRKSNKITAVSILK